MTQMPFLLLITPVIIKNIEGWSSKGKNSYIPMMNGKTALPLCPKLDMRVMPEVCIRRGSNLDAVWMVAV